MISRLSPYLLLFLILALVSGNARTPQAPELAKLQNDFAIHYFEPEPHMALTKYYLDHGDRREAFFTLETARRGILEEAVFDHAFQVAFEGFDNSETAEQKLLTERLQNPHSADLQFKLADIYISRSDWVQANNVLTAALKEHPEAFRFTTALAEILNIQGKSQEASRMIEDYAKRYPESPDGYALRADALQKTGSGDVKRLLEEAIAKYPDDGGLQFKLAIVLQEKGDLDKAEAAFVKAASLRPKSVDIQSWVGRFFFKVRNDGDRALPYYLNAYFLSPHAYETEFVESRLRNIYFAQAALNFQNQIKARKPLIEMLNDPDPNIVEMTLEQMNEKWKPEYVDPLTFLMGHEDGGVRWEATQLLKGRVDSSFDPKLKALLKENDLRKRGLAAYIAVHHWKDASFGFMDELLGEQAELLRFDALSALILEGGVTGKQHAFRHAPRETHPMLKKLLESAQQKKPQVRNWE